MERMLPQFLVQNTVKHRPTKKTKQKYNRLYSKIFEHRGPSIWNKLPEDLREYKSMNKWWTYLNLN